MNFWMIFVVACLLLHYAPDIIPNVVINLFRVILTLVIHVYHAAMAASGAVWIILDLPNQVEMWMSARASHVNRIHAPSEVSGRDDTVDSKVSSSAVATDYTISGTPRKQESLMSIQRCAGYTMSGSPCKREKMKPDDQSGVWYCRDHRKQRPG